jgi:glycerol-3-phosphate O-acyltransferase
LGAFDRAELEKVDKDATVIFVMNHRSNMDYVLVTYLVSRAGALSYAVVEWELIWPLSSIIRAMGAYFIRRRSRGQLYRKVLARYVQMSTDGGVTQAMFPEGGLSLTGKVMEPKLGLLNYIVEGNDPDKRDVVFVPVGLNYDRVLEDRFLVAAKEKGVRRFRPPLWTMVSGVADYFWQRLTGKMRGFGTASVGFGKPLSLREFRDDHEGDLTEGVARELMQRIEKVVPVLSGPLVARTVLQHDGGLKGDVAGQIARDLTDLKSKSMPLPRRDAPALVDDTLQRMSRRGLVQLDGETVRVAEDGRGVLEYYANTIEHHFSADND